MTDWQMLRTIFKSADGDVTSTAILSGSHQKFLTLQQVEEKFLAETQEDVKEKPGAVEEDTYTLKQVQEVLGKLYNKRANSVPDVAYDKYAYHLGQAIHDVDDALKERQGHV